MHTALAVFAPELSCLCWWSKEDGSSYCSSYYTGSVTRFCALLRTFCTLITKRLKSAIADACKTMPRVQPWKGSCMLYLSQMLGEPVIDANGEPLIGVNVKEVGGTTGTITDINGEFSLNVAPKTRLEISFIGYQTQNVAVGESRQITVTLQEDTQVLDEVVITGFGMSQKKATLTGAVSSIKSEEIARSRRRL